MNLGRASVLIAAIAAIGFSHSAFADSDQDWLQDQFDSGNAVPITPGPKPTISEDAGLKQKYLEAIARFNKLTFLPADEAKNYSQNMQNIVGSYGYFEKTDEGQNVVLVGQTSVGQNISVDLKDTTVFKGVLKKGFNAGLKLPILTIDASGDDLAELTIEDIGVVQSKLTLIQWTCQFPYNYYKHAKTKDFFYISAATATKISKKYFKTNEQSGGLLYSILNIGGKRYYSNNQTDIANAISISARPVSLVTTDPFTKDGLALIKAFCSQKPFEAARSVGGKIEPTLNAEGLRGVILKGVRSERLE